MEPINFESEKQIIDSKYKNLNTVTKTSKYLAMGLFIILPFVGSWIGYSVGIADTSVALDHISINTSNMMRGETQIASETTQTSALLSKIDTRELRFDATRYSPEEIYMLIESEMDVCPSPVMEKDESGLDFSNGFGIYGFRLESFTVSLDNREKTDYFQVGPCTILTFNYRFVTTNDEGGIKVSGKLTANDPDAVMMGNPFIPSEESKEQLPKDFSVMFLDDNIVATLRASESVNDGNNILLKYDAEFVLTGFDVTAPFNKGGSPFNIHGVLTSAKKSTP